MQKLKSLFVAFIVMLVTVSYASSMKFKNIVAFGDSLSDIGNFYKASNGIYPPAACYKGRYSDGPVWFEYLIEDIGITGIALNYAYIGAKTGDSNYDERWIEGSEFPGFLDEVKAYLDSAAISQKYPVSFPAPEDTLFIIWIGGNDFWGVTGPEDAEARIKNAALNIQTGLSQLISAGALKFLVMNLPDLGKTPDYNKNETMAAMASGLTAGYNNALELVLSGIEGLYPDITIKRYDSNSMLQNFITNATTFGFTNTSDEKWNKADGSIAEGNYIFWGGPHPTTFTHKIIAKKLVEAINCENCKVSMMPSVSNDFTITIPSAKFGDQTVEFILKPNATETGYFWSLDMESLKVK